MMMTDALTQPLLSPEQDVGELVWGLDDGTEAEFDKETQGVLQALQEQGLDPISAAAGSLSDSGGLSYARQRSLIRRGSALSCQVGGGEGEGEGEAQAQRPRRANCLAWPAEKWKEMQGMAGGPLAFPLKAGIAATLASVLCFLPPLYSAVELNGVWAVVTVDLVLEASVGLTLSKGLNRTMGTMVAAVMALFVNLAGPAFGAYETYFIVFCVFLGAAIPTVFKLRRPFKDKWNYAVVMSMITFHLLILSKSTFPEKLTMPLIRLLTILIGFLVASLVSLSLSPAYAGDLVNKLVAKNFMTAGNVVKRCVVEYCDGRKKEAVSELLRKKAPHDNIHASFYEILAADSEVDKLMKAVPFEPRHANFFWDFPWDLYEDIIDNLRYALYDVIALDACLRAEIQAPMLLRHLFHAELKMIGKQAGTALRLMGESLKHMRRYECQDVVKKADEAAVLLQHKIRKYSRYMLVDHHRIPPSTTMPIPVPGLRPDGSRAATPPTFSFATSFQSFMEPNSVQEASSSALSGHHGLGHTVSRQQDNRVQDSSAVQKTESLQRDWDATVQRIASLSFVKFSSLLIELVAKADYIRRLVDELAVKARFEPGDRSLTTAFDWPEEEDTTTTTPPSV